MQKVKRWERKKYQHFGYKLRIQNVLMRWLHIQKIENLDKYGFFEEVEYEGQETVGSRLVINREEKADGWRRIIRKIGRKGIWRKDAPQSDSPTMLRESIKMFFSVAANEDFELRKIDIRAAFLKQSNWKEKCFAATKDIKREGYIWNLKKPLYRLNDASRKFWLRVKTTFKEIGLRKLDGNEAVYYMKN